jgi:hypothetical protein
MKAELIGIGNNGLTEFYLIEDQVFIVGKGWVPDWQGNPMGMRWECSEEHFNHYRNTVYKHVGQLEITED